ncbi:hypothetical protein A4H97_07305 [Niastella yeongjuensis]|uniref:Uncharacterized protein n=1 Tax=Niastella yeongjuensis TaxID=354355 RepID=A0A1V9EMM3_9BACT|nr:hypothetical protein [Niastella yeongjuensis]OQP47302.1 hypothetical protein A4H97_07305 [Niastella yeongjuensis]SEN77935.1 hypothetical protein SAMN05660816_01485 [Niastella yeongjuensis]
MSEGTKTAYCLFIVSGLLLLTTTCKKRTGQDGDENHTPASNVYILGSIGDSVVYWKNGVAHSLAGQSKVAYNFGSSSLSVSENDVYIAGFRFNNISNFSTSPLYWKNEVPTALPDTSRDGFASSIFISNNDVYVAGIGNYFKDTFHVPYTTPSAVYPKIGNMATIWKNGVAAPLPGFNTIGLSGGGQYGVSMYADYVSGLFVSGNDVYVAGGSRFSGNNASYWKNGVLVDLSKETTYEAANGTHCYPTTTSISVSGNDVYVAGYQLTSTYNSLALYWKNGVPVYLSTDSIGGRSAANSIFVSGNDVYIAGQQVINNYSRAIYWKNGVPTTLTTGAVSSVANAVFVAGDDVYVAGYQWAPGASTTAAYWKNGEVVNLTDGTKNAIANSICIQ